jgi:hypothetical protein
MLYQHPEYQLHLSGIDFGINSSRICAGVWLGGILNKKYKSATQQNSKNDLQPGTKKSVSYIICL